MDVAVDSATAFKAFTEEMDLWWVRGPINFWSDGGRVAEVRCEPGVGGRIIEVLDDRSSAEAFERGRITLWEPGVRLAWDSSPDDVQTEVRFDPIDGGTRVTVRHVIPPDGRDIGGTAWSRVVPDWFAAWCAKRDRVPHQPTDIARLSLGLSYARPAAAMRWLHEGFGLGRIEDIPAGSDPLPEDDPGHPWIEFRVGNSLFIILRLEGERPAGIHTHVPWVYVDDLETHFAHAKGYGATIVEEIHLYPGSLTYVAEDLEGNRWTFLQARPTMR